MEAYGDCMKKGAILRMWHQAGGIYITKEKSISRPISLLIVEGKIFFSVVARTLISYLMANSLIDISVQKAGIPELLAHTRMIWHSILVTKTEGRNLLVVFLVFLDLASQSIF